MEWVDVFIQYLRAYEQKDLDSVSDMFADDIALRDWKISVKGKRLAVDETRKNFENADSIEIDVLSTMVNEKMVSGELKIVVDKSETLFVVDVLKFNENGKIIAIHAYLGRDDQIQRKQYKYKEQVFMELNQVTLPVTNMVEAVEFYLTLGFTQIVDTPHYARFTCPEGSSTFSVSLESESAQNHSVIYFEHEALDELYTSLVEKGIRFEQPPTQQRYLWKEAILRDPSGNKIKLYWAGENRVNPPWKVEIKQQPFR